MGKSFNDDLTTVRPDLIRSVNKVDYYDLNDGASATNKQPIGFGNNMVAEFFGMFNIPVEGEWEFRIEAYGDERYSF